MKTSLYLSLLRFIAAIVIVLFSLEIISDIVISDGTQVEIVDLDLDDDSELDIENDFMDEIHVTSISEAHLNKLSPIFSNYLRLDSQHLEELHSPPPEGI